MGHARFITVTTLPSLDNYTTHDLKCRTGYTVSGLLVYGSSDSTKSPASGIATVREPRLMSQVEKVREVACA